MEMGNVQTRQQPDKRGETAVDYQWLFNTAITCSLKGMSY